MGRRDSGAPMRARVPMGLSYCTSRVYSLGSLLAAQVRARFDQFSAAVRDGGVPGDVPVTLRGLVGGDLAGVDPTEYGATADAELVAQLADGQFAGAGGEPALVTGAEAGGCGDEFAAVGFDGVVEA